MKLFALTFSFFLLSGVNLYAQNSHSLLDNYDVKVRVNSDGILFMDPGSIRPGWEYPVGSGKHVIFSAGLWIGGYDQGGALHLAAQTYRYGESDFWCGPLSSQNGSPFLPSLWDDLWGIQKSDIDYHKLNYNESGYVMPTDISEWPGSSYQGIQQVIAPFADTDHNGVYNPEQGDYPVISGDDAVYFVFNDLYAQHTQSSGLPLGVEVYAMAFQVASSDPALRNTVFVRYRIRNRSVFSYDSLLLGIFADFDIGNPFDDYYGTSVNRHMLYAMNGDSVDGSGASGEYGLYPPASGVLLLSHDAAHTMCWYNQNQPTGNPSNSIAGEYYRLMNGQWRDGINLSFGGSGYQSGSVPADYIYSGDTDPAHPGLLWNCDSSADYRGLISTGPLTLSAGAFLTFDVAFTCALGIPGQSDELLFSYADRIRAYHQSQVNGLLEKTEVDLDVFPNPADERIYLKSHGNSGVNGRWMIYDLSGRPVLTISRLIGSEGINISGLSSGLYWVMFVDETGRILGKQKLVRR